MQFAFAALVLWVLVRGPWTARFVAVGTALGLMAYASPYLIGINYERHITPWMLLVFLSAAWLVQQVQQGPPDRQGTAA